MKIKCHNERCVKANENKPYEWDYQGKNPFYAPCPRCKASINIQKTNVKGGQEK